MADKQLFELDGLASPAAEDFVLASDTSGSNAPKKLLLSVLRNFILGTAACFNAIGANFKLLADMDAGQKKITNLKAGSNAGDAVNYEQVEGLVTAELPALAAPTLTPGATSLLFRAAVAPISYPNYLFYYCLDTNAGTTLSVSGGAVVSSSSAAVHEIASANNSATLVRDAGMTGKYIHLAVRYRNALNVSPLSPTLSQQITEQGVPDFVAPDFSLDEPTGQIVGNRLVVSAPTAGPGVHYVLTILFNSQESYSITGSEAELVRLSSAVPNFSYDITLAQSSAQYAHYSLTAVPLIGESKTMKGASLALNIEDMFSDQLITLLAGRIADKLVTQTDEPLKLKGV